MTNSYSKVLRLRRRLNHWANLPVQRRPMNECLDARRKCKNDGIVRSKPINSKTLDRTKIFSALNFLRSPFSDENSRAHPHRRWTIRYCPRGKKIQQNRSIKRMNPYRKRKDIRCVRSFQSSVQVRLLLKEDEEEQRESSAFISLTNKIAALTILTDTATSGSRSSRATAFVLCGTSIGHCLSNDILFFFFFFFFFLRRLLLVLLLLDENRSQVISRLNNFSSYEFVFQFIFFLGDCFSHGC